MSEDDIYIGKVNGGDNNAYAFLVDKYKNMAFTLAYRLCSNREDAEDITQEAFIAAYRALTGFRQGARFSTWLYRIVYNKAISGLRKRKADKNLAEKEKINESEAIIYTDYLKTIQDKERKKYIELAMDDLVETERFIMTLYYYDDASVEEICDITGLTASNVKVKLYRARKKLYLTLKSLLKEEVEELL